MPDDPSDHSAGGTSEGASLVPGLNRIGALLDEITKGIQHNQKGALKGWVEGAKWLVIVTDVHGLRGPDYVQFAVSHLPIEGKTAGAKERAAYELYLLGFAKEGQPANGDLIIQECEAQAKLRPHNFEWPHWRNVTARLRREARENQQGDGIPAGEEDADPDAGEGTDTAEDTEDAGGSAPDAPEKDTRPVDPVAEIDAANQKLRIELDTVRQSYRSERAAREEMQDALHRLRSDITRLLCESEKALWDAMPPPPPPHTPVSQPEPISETAPEPEPTEPAAEPIDPPLSEAQIGPTADVIAFPVPWQTPHDPEPPHPIPSDHRTTTRSRAATHRSGSCQPYLSAPAARDLRDRRRSAAFGADGRLDDGRLLPIERRFGRMGAMGWQSQ